MQTGSCLVPVISFGENNIFQVSRPEEKSVMATVQKYVQLHPALIWQLCCASYVLSCKGMHELVLYLSPCLMSGLPEVILLMAVQ